MGIACENLQWSVCDNEDRIWSVMGTDIVCSRCSSFVAGSVMGIDIVCSH